MGVELSWIISIVANQSFSRLLLGNGNLRLEEMLQIISDLSISQLKNSSCKLFHILVHLAVEVVSFGKRNSLESQHVLLVLKHLLRSIDHLQLVAKLLLEIWSHLVSIGFRKADQKMSESINNRKRKTLGMRVLSVDGKVSKECDEFLIVVDAQFFELLVVERNFLDIIHNGFANLFILFLRKSRFTFKAFLEASQSGGVQFILIASLFRNRLF